MTMKNIALLTSLIALGSLSASAGTTTGFGTIPGAAANAYSGTGIPINTSVYETITGAPLPSGDTLTLAMAATQHGAGNPAPGTNVAGTYTVGLGLVGGRSKWNFDFYVNSAAGDLSDYTFSLVEAGNGHTFSFDPTAIGDDVGAPNSKGNSESLDFTPFGTALGYNPNQNDTYKFTLEAFLGGNEIGADSITVVAGTGSVPDAASTMSLLGLSFGALVGLRRRFNRA